jgi:hypothetical protein
VDTRKYLSFQAIEPFEFLAKALACTAGLAALLTARDLLSLAGNRGLVDPALSLALDPNAPLSLFRWIKPGSASVDLALTVLLNLVAISSAFLIWRPRSICASLALYLSFTSFRQTAVLVTYGMHQYIQIGVFYVLLANIVVRIEQNSASTQVHPVRYVGWLARIHLAMAYTFSGLCKGVGPQWWSGESMWRALGRTDLTGLRPIDLSWASQFPLALQAIGISVVLVETLYGLAFVRRLRPYVIGGMIAMHVGTMIVQGLWIFGFVMIALNVFFLAEGLAWERAVGIRQSLNPSPTPACEV